LLSPGVPSVTLVHCTHTAEDIIKLLVRPDSTISQTSATSERRRWSPAFDCTRRKETLWMLLHYYEQFHAVTK